MRLATAAVLYFMFRMTIELSYAIFGVRLQRYDP